MRSTHDASRLARGGVAVLSAGILALALAACGSSSSSSSGTTPSASSGTSTSSSPTHASYPPIPAGPIKVGIIGALSGSDAAIGGLVKAEFTAYAAYLSKHGGIDGHPVDILFYNNQSNPTVAVSVAKQLIAAHPVATFYNGSTAEAKDEVVALEQRAKIIGISPEALEQYDNAKAYPYYFSDNSSDSQVTDALAGYAKSRGFNDFGVLGDGSPQADDYLTQFGKSAAADGLKIVKTTSYPSTATTMTTELSTLKAAGAKTLGLFCYSGCGQVFDSLRQIQWKPNVLVSPNIYYTAFTSVGNYGSVTYSACPYSVNPGQNPPAPAAAAINVIAPVLGGKSALDQVYPETADAFGILKYAITHANSLDPDALVAAIQSMTKVSFSDPEVTFTFSSVHHSGYQPGTSNGLMPICGFAKLGADDLPVRVPFGS